MISLKDVSVCYPGISQPAQSALTALTLDVPERYVGVIGANGSGKSTFARLLNGLVTPTVGSVTVCGIDVATKPTESRKITGFLFQNPEAQVVMPTVLEDVAFGPRQHGASITEATEGAQSALDDLGIAHLAYRDCFGLSGGELQLVALAGVLVLKPSVLVLDEPTALLDARHARRLLDIVGGLDVQVIHITHRLEELTSADRVICFENGVVVTDGTPRDVIASYQKSIAS